MAKRKAKKPVKKTVPVELVEYCGILDTMGLDSFAPYDNRTANMMHLRAGFNPHRHACLFIASIRSDIDVVKHIKKIKDAWDRWAYIQLISKEVKCEPKDAKTIKNMKKLADSMIACTGSALGC